MLIKFQDTQGKLATDQRLVSSYYIHWSHELD